MALRVQDDEVRVGSRGQRALICDLRCARRILAGGRHGLGQIPFREKRQIAYGTVHGQNASGQLAVCQAFAIANIHFERPKPVAAIGHAGGRNSIGDEHGLLRAFGVGYEFHNDGVEMNAVGDEVRADAAIGEHRTQNAGTAMVQRTHGVEGMGSVARSRRNAPFGGRKIGVGMPKAHADAAPRGFGDDLERAVQFGSNRHHANAAARGLPELLEQSQGWSEQIFQRVNPAPRMADEWSLEMDSEGEGPNLRTLIIADAKIAGVAFALLFGLLFALFDRIRHVFQSAQSGSHGSGDGSWKIARDPVPGQQLLDGRQRLRGIVHDVVSGAAVNVKIEVAGRDDAMAEVGHGNSGGDLPAALRGNFENASLFDEQERMLDDVGRSQQSSSSKSQHRNVLMAAKRRL